ncbi:replication-relaxation family protein [Lentzea aerocolonigenes]|uniref:replication-relaxation family protein n=1 Tax=Lentzea aerocolonigenes TaxID=68170 RepID=UPI00138E0B6D|nr:replication-relaxation family protein [Lentzea aerocolonigenes]
MTRELSERDRLVVEYVGRFRQLTAGQLRTFVFGELASQTPCDRTLKRLVDGKYLMRLHRLVGGTQGGSAQYVYQLGRQGWRLLGRAGEYWAPRAVNLHALAIADCMVKLKTAERQEVFKVVSFTTEPACHVAVGGLLLTPDAFVELKLSDSSERLISWLEVDRGTEHLSTIQEKCERYWKASISGQWDGNFPFVLFVVPDEQRKHAIERIFRAGPIGARELFSACPMARFPPVATSRTPH